MLLSVLASKRRRHMVYVGIDVTRACSKTTARHRIFEVSLKHTQLSSPIQPVIAANEVSPTVVAKAKYPERFGTWVKITGNDPAISVISYGE